MSLTTLLENELQQRSGMPSGLFRVASGEESVSMHLVRVDSLAVAFESFLFETSRLVRAETKRLTAIADTLASQLNYLLEPLRVIEIDGDAGAVQMRSSQPTRRAEQKVYYELLVRRGGSISLDRYEKQAGQTRTSAAAVVTREVFSRLVADLQSATR